MKSILIALALITALTGCMTYRKALRKYATVHADTTYTTVQVAVPRDSAVIRLRTDTTRVVERVRQGRATVTIIREPTYTTVRADCDSVLATRKVATQIVTQKWGVDPAYKTSSERWRLVALVLGIGIGLAALLGWLNSRFAVAVSRK